MIPQPQETDTETTRPKALGVTPDTIPTELKDINAWVLWRYEPSKNNKWTKVPYQLDGQAHASSTDPSTWGTFRVALKRYNDGGVDGIGIVLTKEFGIVGIDLDHCYNLETRKLEEGSIDIIQKMNSYSEFSPSGEGVRIFVKGTLPEGATGRKKGNIEIYQAARYLTVTGHASKSMPQTIEVRQEAINELYEQVFGAPETKQSDLNRHNGQHLELKDDVLLEKAFSANNGQKIKRLYGGDFSEYPSQSEADLALCSCLAFWTEDRTQLDGLFRNSGLYREKWDERHYGDGQTYGEKTIAKALEGSGQISRISKISSPPEPLRRALPPSEPYPVEALGDILGPAAKEMHEVIQSPVAICAQSLLAGASLAVQAHADVTIDGRKYPLSEYFVTVAESGERKTATDNIALGPHEKRQRDLRAECESSIQEYEADCVAWKKHRDDTLSSKKDCLRQEIREALLDLGPEPQPPLNGTLVTKEPTYEGLVRALAEGWPSMGIFSSEGGRFIGGHGMNPDNRLKTASGLSELWDGAPISRTRGGEGNSLLYGKRLSLHLMVQPEISTQLLGDSLLLNQGLLSRFLVAYPNSTIGGRAYKSIDLNQEPGMKRYFARLSHILDQPLPLAENTRNELNPRELTLEPDAKYLWVRVHDYTEGLLRDGEKLSPIRGLAAKGAEHCARLAGILAVVDDFQTTTVKTQYMEAAITLTDYYLSEGLRLFTNSHDKPDLILAERLLAWVQTLESKTVYLALVYQYGPNQIRDQETARKTIRILVAHGWLVPVRGGQEIDGIHRGEVWSVVK